MLTRPVPTGRRAGRLTCDQRLCDRQGRGILMHVLRVETGDDHLGQSDAAQGGDLFLADAAALPQASARQGHGMGKDRAFGLIEGDRAELHQRRRVAVIWAMMLTAISAGVRAPMSSPTGAWMRAISSGEKPCAVSRSTRRAWVFFDPSAPM
jgi:hypothetical protein